MSRRESESRRARAEFETLVRRMDARIEEALRDSEREGAVVTGSVFWVDRSARVIWVDRGAESGVRVGEKGVAYSDGGSEGRFVVWHVFLDNCMCRVDTGSRTPEVGEHVRIGD